MHFKTFFFLLFILASILFFLVTYQPDFSLTLCDTLCHNKLSLKFIQLTSMSMSTISLILFIINSYYVERKVIREKEKLLADRLNIEKIHAELEALKIKS